MHSKNPVDGINSCRVWVINLRGDRYETIKDIEGILLFKQLYIAVSGYNRFIPHRPVLKG